jgi:protocatechuate 3,4-dioxygenase beta subunit
MFNYRIRPNALVAAASTIILITVFGFNLVVAQSETPPSSDSAGEKKRQLVNLWQPGDPGQRINIRGRVTSIDGTPVTGASIFIRQADGNGDYHDNRYNATLESDQKGGYQFASVLPGQYYGIKHVHIWVNHDDYQSMDTRIIFKGDPNLDESTSPEAIFLEEGNANGETIMFGRFDIVLTPR